MKWKRSHEKRPRVDKIQNEQKGEIKQKTGLGRDFERILLRDIIKD